MALTVISNYKTWLGKTLYNNEEPTFKQIEKSTFKLNYKEFDILITFFEVTENTCYGICFEWLNKAGKLHREEGPAVEYWYGALNGPFNVCRNYYYLNGDNIPSYNKSDIEIEDDEDLVILEKEMVSPLFWKVKYLTSNEIKEEYIFNLTEQILVNNRLCYLKMDSK